MDDLNSLPKVLDYIKKCGLLASCENNDLQPGDVTRKSLEFPSTRSERLQILTRGQTGAVTALAYAVIRGDGALHPTVGELRVGQQSVLKSSQHKSKGNLKYHLDARIGK